MSEHEHEDRGEVSEIDRLRPGGIQDDGDPAPYAMYAEQVAEGAPEDYRPDDPQVAEELDEETSGDRPEELDEETPRDRPEER